MIDLTEYKNKNAGDGIKASEWNEMLSKIEEGSNISVPVTDVWVNGETIVSTDGIAKIELKQEVPDESEFYVNGVLQTIPDDGIVKLSAEGTYTLKGKLNGQVLIPTAADIVNDTFIVLDGVEIKTDSVDNYGIMYAPEAETLHVILPVNTLNYISCTNEAAIAEEQKAALYSEKNLIVQGDGTLNVLNKGGHGIKASELRIMGDPTIVVDAIHDAIHGNSALDIYGGTFKINAANDAFGTGTTGSIKVFGGSFEANNILGNVFDSKVAGLFYTKVPIITSLTDYSAIVSGMTDIDPATAFDAGSVICYSDEAMTLDEELITPVDNIYTLKTAYAKVRGYIEGSITANTQSTDISLNGAYITGGISYSAEKKKLKITSEKDTINFIKNTSDAVKSTKNVSIEVKSKSYLGLRSTEGYGLTGFEITINDSKGVLSIENCGNGGIYCQEKLYIGTDADAKGKTLEGALMVSGNKNYDIYVKNRDQVSDSGIVKVLDSGLKGVVSAGNITAEQYIDLNSSRKVACKTLNRVVIGNPGNCIK